jgi:outer membrane lipoprotein-sorting protein
MAATRLARKPIMKLINNQISVRIIITLFAASLFIGWGDSWDTIRKTARDITSIEAEFVQKKNMEILSKPLVSTGRLYFQVPRSLRWEYATPVKSTLLMHGGRVTRYIKKGDRLIKDSSAGLQSMQIVLSEIIQWMKGSFDANPGFRPELKPGRIIVLTPKEKSISEIIQRIELKLSRVPGVIQTVTIYESRKSYTVIEFSQVRINRALPDSLFKGI